MNNLPLAPQLLLPNVPEDSNPTWEDDSTSTSDDSDDEAGSILDIDCADKGYWKDETAGDAWLSRFPGGTSALYPKLFLVNPRGKVVTPTRYPNRTNALLHLPPEIRNRIYRYYFDGDEEVGHPKESYAPFHNREGRAMQRILIDSENRELKFWLSRALLQTSRQLRHEAMSILFNNRAIMVVWLPALPRLVEFLGKGGCEMVRYLDMWDMLDVQGEDVAGYRKIITSIMHFPGLLHLRIVVSWSIRQIEQRSRSFAWLDATELNADGTPKEDAIPKMRAENIDLHWPECDVLKKLKAQKFTLAAITPGNRYLDRYLEFDRSYGPLSDIIQSMQPDPAPMQSIASAAALASSPFEDVETQPQSSASIPNSGVDDEGPDSHALEDTDLLTNKIIPFYNFLREFYHNKSPCGPSESYANVSFQKFITFPTARNSTGTIIRDCVFCYISEQHCGYHAMPDQPPFEFIVPRDDVERELLRVEKDAKLLQEQFQDLSYLDMRMVCRELVQWMDVNGPARVYYHKNFVFQKMSAFLDYQGWPETPHSDRLAGLDSAVDAGWTGKKVDKDEIAIWDILYREIISHHSHLIKFREEKLDS